MSSNGKSKDKNYKCSINIQFPTPHLAQSAMEVLSVDEEIGDKVTKDFQVQEHSMIV